MSDDTERELAAEMASGIRSLADMIEANPELARTFRHSFVTAGINAMPHGEDTAAQMADIARIGLRHKAKVTKEIDEKWHNLVLMFGVVRVKVLAYRDEVCERVVVGTETVTSKVPDPDLLAKVPEVEVTETRDVVEWRCSPLLASGSDGAA